MAVGNPKKCERCGVVFWKGNRYNTVVLVLLVLFLFPVGVIYYFVKRKQRCPRCDSKEWHETSQAEFEEAKAAKNIIGL